MIVTASQLKAGDIVKVRIFSDPNHKTPVKTRNLDVMYSVYKKDGRLGIDYDKPEDSLLSRQDGFRALDEFSAMTVKFDLLSREEA